MAILLITNVRSRVNQIDNQYSIWTSLMLMSVTRPYQHLHITLMQQKSQYMVTLLSILPTLNLGLGSTVFTVSSMARSFTSNSKNYKFVKMNVAGPRTGLVLAPLVVVQQTTTQQIVVL